MKSDTANSISNQTPDASEKITRRGLFRAATKTIVRGGIVAGVLGGGSLAYANKIAPAGCRFSEFELPIAHLPREFDGYRIAQVTDLHLDEEPNTTRVFSLFAQINAWQPDAVLLTGDYVSNDPRVIEKTFASALQTLQSRDGTFAVMGNHDHWSSEGPRMEPLTLRRVFERSKVRELPNDVAFVRRGEAQICIAGIDSLSGHADLPQVLKRLPAERLATIVMMHEPDFADQTAPTGRFDLQLSGHSHGGQVNVPFVGPPILPRGGRKYHTGLHSIGYETPDGNGAMWQFTSRGTGTSGLRIRFNCPPEIACITLRCAR